MITAIGPTRGSHIGEPARVERGSARHLNELLSLPQTKERIAAVARPRNQQHSSLGGGQPRSPRQNWMTRA